MATTGTGAGVSRRTPDIHLNGRDDTEAIRRKDLPPVQRAKAP